MLRSPALAHALFCLLMGLRFGPDFLGSARAEALGNGADARAAVTFRLPRFADPVAGSQFSHRAGSNAAHGSGPVDLNGDGRPEIVQAYSNFPGLGPDRPEPIVLLGVSPSAFTYSEKTSAFLAGDVPKQVHSRVLEVRDFNDDGKLDYFLGGHGYDADPFDGEPDWLILSRTGQKHVGRSVPPKEDTYTHAAASGDIDRDGIDDIYVGVLCCSEQGPYFLLGRKEKMPVPSFNRLNATVADRAETYTAAALVDVDGVKGPDLVLGAFQAPDSVVYLNDGAGNFLSANPDLTLPTGLFGTGNSQTVDILPVDVDTNGKPDLILSQTMNDPFYEGYGLQVLVKKAGAGFDDQTSKRMRSGSGMDADGLWRAKLFAADFFGDGIVDFLSSRFCGGGLDDYVIWLNDGSGVFTPQKRRLIDKTDAAEDCNMIYPVDVDKDGRSDIARLVGVSGTSDRMLTYRNLGPAASGAATVPEIVRQPKALTVEAGDPLLLSVSARGARPLKFQWFRNNKAITDAKGPIYAVPATAAGDGGRYKVRVQNAVGSAVSEVLKVTIN